MSLTRCQLLSFNPATQVTVYKGLLSASTAVAIKEQVFDSLQKANSTIRAAIAMSTLTNSGVLKVYDCAVEETETGFRSVLVQEWMETDLEQEIRRRKRKGEYWSDVELITVLISLVKALSFAQKQGISHGDIQPCSIFLTNSTFKIGNFRSSNRIFDSLQAQPSLHSPPIYLSPELKRHYQGAAPLSHDSVKSDVYSLAVTLLEMANLEPPVRLGDLQQLRVETDQVVRELKRYPHLQYYLTWMMEEQVEKRPTFEELELYMERFAQYYDDLAAQNAADLSQQTLILRTNEEEKRDPNSPNPEEMAKSAPNPPIPTPIPKPQCAMCANTLPAKPLKVPKGLQNAAQYAVSVCSLKCLRQIRNMLKSEEEQCCNCGYIGTFQHPLELKCGHKFHDKDCLFQFIRKNSNDFKRKLTYECPTCTQKINYRKVIQPYVTTEELEQWKIQWKEVKCCQCQSVEVRYEEENRLYCDKCAQSRLEGGE